MHRPTVGILALLLLATGAATEWLVPLDDDLIPGACLRVGIVLAALWLALPNMNRFPRWQLVGLALGLLAVLRWPKLILFAIPIGVLVWLLGPRPPAKR